MERCWSPEHKSVQVLVSCGPVSTGTQFVCNPEVWRNYIQLKIAYLKHPCFHASKFDNTNLLCRLLFCLFGLQSKSEWTNGMIVDKVYNFSSWNWLLTCLSCINSSWVVHCLSASVLERQHKFNTLNSGYTGYSFLIWTCFGCVRFQKKGIWCVLGLGLVLLLEIFFLVFTSIAFWS